MVSGLVGIGGDTAYPDLLWIKSVSTCLSEASSTEKIMLTMTAMDGKMRRARIEVEIRELCGEQTISAGSSILVAWWK